MNSLVLAGLVMGGYLLAYHTYGKFLARKIFNINPDAVCPSTAFQDNFDFVPTKKEILFGHHFASIAGLGPIVGPAIAIIWGWVPAVIWIFFGAIFFGAVHDFGALIISLRAKGRSIGDITGDVINARSRILFLLIIFFALLIVIAVFGLIMAILFTIYPAAVIPIWLEIIIALCLGHIVYKKGIDILWPSIIAVMIMYLTVVAGVYWPVDLKIILGISAEYELITWIIIVLLFSSWLASSLPVQTLMQPRDFINSHQLLVTMALLCLGILIAHPSVVAPATNFSVKGAPPILPFIFVIIACGAISGFHSLVSSGTTSKQCASEADAQFIGYGGLLLEGTLATLVIIAISAGIGLGLPGSGGEMLIGKAAFIHHYSSWEAASGLGSKLEAFIYGSGNMIQACGIPHDIAIAIMSVFVVSFASTTIDTATRIQRYVVVELACSYNFKFLAKRQVGTAFAVITAGLLAFYDGTGKGALKLWPLFGSVNQLMASLSLMIITIYLAKQRIRAVYTFLPMIFMIVITCWALTLNLNNFFLTGNWLLFFIGIFIFALQVWLIIEGLIIWKKIKSLQ